MGSVMLDPPWVYTHQTNKISSIDLVRQDEVCDFTHVGGRIAIELQVILVLDFHHRDEVRPLKLAMGVIFPLHQDGVRLVRPGPMVRLPTQGGDRDCARVEPQPCIFTEHFNYAGAVHLGDGRIDC